MGRRFDVVLVVLEDVDRFQAGAGMRAPLQGAVVDAVQQRFPFGVHQFIVKLAGGERNGVLKAIGVRCVWRDEHNIAADERAFAAAVDVLARALED